MNEILNQLNTTKRIEDIQTSIENFLKPLDRTKEISIGLKKQEWELYVNYLSVKNNWSKELNSIIDNIGWFPYEKTSIKIHRKS